MNKIVAIACSTGGPKALQSIIPSLNSRLNCPVVIVQHMTGGFTKTLSERLNLLTDIPVTEAFDGEIIEDNHIYIAKAGYHLKIKPYRGGHKIVLEDGELREGVKPCANYMYESLAECRYDEIICVVLTGMGSDGTEGIMYLKEKKNIRVIVQDKDTSVVFGMPGSVLKTDIVCTVSKIEDIGKEILKQLEG